MIGRLASPLLFGALALVVPLPLLGLGGTVVPLARFGQLGSALGALAAVEGTEGMAGVFLGLLWGHVLVYALVLAAACWVLRRGLARVAGECTPLVLVALAVAALFWGVVFAEYRSAFHHTTSHATLSELYR